MREITDAITATSVAKRAIGWPKVFQPISAKKVRKYWLVKGNVGALDDIIVTIKLPEKLIGMCK